jgi:glycosyltransferase involved in cell wall biosynthesis
MISAVILTHNSENTLLQTLKSCSFCDERIVIDDGSTDGSVALAKKSGAKVFTNTLDGNFAAQRNFGLSKATHDWVLFIDSDEVVSKALADEIKRMTETADVAGFYLKRDDVLWGRVLKHGETGNVRLLRLAKKASGVWIHPVHEVWELNGMTGTLTNPLLHYPHPNVAQFLDAINRYSTLQAQYLFAKKIREPWWYVAVYPPAKFFVNYVWHLGFLDGTPGAIVAIMMSFHSFLVRAKLWHLYHPSPTRQV